MAANGNWDGFLSLQWKPRDGGNGQFLWLQRSCSIVKLIELRIGHCNLSWHVFQLYIEGSAQDSVFLIGRVRLSLTLSQNPRRRKGSWKPSQAAWRSPSQGDDTSSDVLVPVISPGSGKSRMQIS